MLPTATPSAAPWPIVGSTAPTVRETTITLNTYDYEPALLPTTSDDPAYPYPRLDQNQVGPPSPRSYRALVLENRYLELTVLPELGGRIYRWIDKTGGKNLFYQNPVIKPTSWGYRGWWLATGGMEWALPVEEHGLSEATPWDYAVTVDAGSAAVTVSDIEKHSGLVCAVTIRLDEDHSYFSLQPQITNPTSSTVRYEFWLNGMFGLGAQQVGPGLEFVLPITQVVVHSTGDETLPNAGEVISWPIYQGRDLSDYGAWRKYLGVFAYPAAGADFMGAYNHTTGLGVVRIFPHEVARGAKIFGPGDIDPGVWTDDGSSYVELWGGLAPTFGDTVALEPGKSVTWQEHWYAIPCMGGFAYANDMAALDLSLTESTVEVAAAVTADVTGRVTLFHDGRPAANWQVSLVPGQAFRGSFRPPRGEVAGRWEVVLVDATGKRIAAMPQTGAEGRLGP
jgi:hypothetical protein